MPAPLRCPTCSAPLDLPPAHADTLRCTYCGAGVLLTERSGQVQAAASHPQHTRAIAEVLKHLHAGDKIGAIRVYREHFGLGLTEAKDAVDRLEASRGAEMLTRHMEDAASQSRQGEAMTAVLGKLRAGNKIAAIKVYREQFGVGLKEAKDAVELLAASQPPGTIPAPAGNPKAVLGAVLAVLAIVMAGVLMMRDGGADPPVPTTPPPASPANLATPTPEPPVETGIAREVMRFGSEGTGAGRFEDARSVAVDGAGRIYVAEYTGGRVQVFDSAGTFLTQWMADPRMPLVDMAADRGGTLYIVQSGRIKRFEGATGRALGEVRSPAGFGFKDLTVALDGSLWTVTGEAVLHLSRDGTVLRTIDIEQAVDEDASAARIAVSGAGDLYVLDQWKAHVYHLNRDGRFVDRFGGGGFPPAEDVAVDGRGRVFVSDLRGAIRVFDASGQPMGDIGGAGLVFGVALNDRDEVFAAARNAHAIVKYRLAP